LPTNLYLSTAKCPSEAVFDRFLVGGLPPSETLDLERHIDGCQRCQRLLLQRFERWSKTHNSVSSPPSMAPGLAEATGPGPIPEPHQRYLLLEEIAAGRTGRTCAAYDSLLGRKVSLTFLASPAAEQTLQARVMREATAMARLSHPNLVRVHDVGMREGVPYLTMELVEGPTLARRFGPERPSDARAIAQLMAGIARGLAAAHAAGVLHRDVNPNNIVVTEHRVVLTSFGISLPDDGGTASGPMYPAPEQRLGRPFSTAADVFGFCATVYQLIHGRSPVEDLANGNLAAPPRARVLARLHRLALRGLDPDPARRPSDLERLAQDLLAVPGRRLPAAAVVAAAGLAAAFWVGGYLKDSPERRCLAGVAAIDTSWNDATRSQLRQRYQGAGPPAAGAWGAFERMVDGYVERWRTMYGQTCAQSHSASGQSDQVLDLRLDCLQARRSALEAFVGALPGASPLQLVKAPSARLPEVADCGITDRLGLKPLPSDPQLRARIAEIERLVGRAQADHNLGEFRRAELTAVQAIEGARKVGYEPLLASALISRATILVDMGSSADNQEGTGVERTSALFAEAHAVAERGGDDRQRLTVAREQVLLQARAQKYAEAERWARLGQALLVRLDSPAEEASRLAQHEGYLHKFQRRSKQAAAAFQRALEFAEKMPPAPKPRRVAAVLVGLCSVKEDTGERITCARHCADLTASVLGPDHPSTVVARAALAEALVLQPSTHAEACSIFRLVRTSMDQTIDRSHPNAIAVLTQLAECVAVERQLPEARSLFEEVLARKLGPVDRGFALEGLGLVLFSQGDLEGAIQRIEAGLASLKSAFEPGNDAVMYTRGSLAEVLIHADQTSEAQRVLQEGLDDARKAGVMTTNVAHLRAQQGAVLLWQRRPEPAVRAFEDALRLHGTVKTPEAKLGYTLAGLSTALLDLERVESARGHVERAFAARPEDSLLEGEVRADITFAMARLLLATGGDRTRGCALAREAADVYRLRGNVGKKRERAGQFLGRHRCAVAS
jgi:tetratricopeptide (TPR) repeat protein